MSEQEAGGEPVGGSLGAGLLWGVGAVSVRLGIATPTLRTWERRYGIGPSRRTEGGHRRYSEDDIGRVQLMAHLVSTGVPAQSAAQVALSLDRGELGAALEEHAVAVVDSRHGVSPTVISQIADAAADLDAQALSSLFSRALGSGGITQVWTNLLVPALQEIGLRWANGTLGIDSEHLASERLAAELHAAIRRHDPPRFGRSPLVLLSVEGEQHTLPVLALELALAEDGIACLALGARVPSGALLDLIDRVAPAGVFVWASIEQGGIDRTSEALARTTGTSIVFGGPAWGDRDLPGEQVDDLAASVRRMRDLWQDRDPSRSG